MNSVKQDIDTSDSLPVEEYIRLGLQSERRHEYINGQLFEMPGEKDMIPLLDVSLPLSEVYR